MTCDRCEEAFAAYIDGLLDRDMASEIDDHLSDCPACQATLELTRRLVDRLTAGGRLAPGASIADAVMGRIIRKQALQLKKDQIMRHRIRNISAAAALLIIGLGVVLADPLWAPSGTKIFADDLRAARKQVEGARTARWTIAYYEHYLRKDGTQSRWFKDRNNDQRYYYSSPGVYRCESLDSHGVVQFYSIEDVTSRTKLEVNHRDKTAKLTYLIERGYNPKGPFAKYLNAIESSELRALGKRSIGGRDADGYRHTFQHEGVNKRLSFDFWLDSTTKRLVLCKDPGDDIFDSAEIVKGEGQDTPNDVESEGATYKRKIDRFGEPGDTGHIIDSIVFDEELDPALFSFDPPKGYDFKTVPPPEFTEADAIGFMGIVARYFDQKFPDHLPNFFRGNKAEYERFERVEHGVMGGQAATAAEKDMVQGIHKWWRLGVPGTGPINIYIAEKTVEGSWKYLGKGVKLGEVGRIVCWYRPKGSRTYHVVYGDLSVKEVEEQDLPLPVNR